MATEGYTRKQMFLKKLNDSNFSTPVPVTVEEEIIDGGGSSGSNEFVINVLHGMEGSTLDKTYDEVIEALQNGLTPVIYSKASGEQGNLLSTVKYTFSDYRYIPDRQYQFIVFVGFLGNIFPDQTDAWTPALDISILYFMSDNTIHYGVANLTVENDD